jgi:hypothetical protein
MGYKKTQRADRTILRSAYSDFCLTPPVVGRLFEVNSEPHTGARPSVRLCVGLITSLTHKRTGGLAPVWGSEFTTKAAHYKGGSEEFTPGLYIHFGDLVTA